MFERLRELRKRNDMRGYGKAFGASVEPLSYIHYLTFSGIIGI